MCTEVQTLHQECGHKVYQNTFECHVPRRCSPDDEEKMGFSHTKFLPARQPNVPPGMLGCKVRKATRPVTGLCPECKKAKSSNSFRVSLQSDDTSIWTSSSSTSSLPQPEQSMPDDESSTVQTDQKSQKRESSRAQKDEQLKQVHYNFHRLSMIQEGTPEKESESLKMTKKDKGK